MWGWNWTDFWTNLASTIVGVTIGVPIALGVERWVERRSERKQSERDQARLRSALAALQSCIEVNVGSLSKTEGFLIADKVPLAMATDLFTWEAVRSDIVELISDPVKKVTIAHFFALLTMIARLVDQYFDQSVGPCSALGNSPNTRAAIRARLLELIPSARSVGEGIRAGLAEIESNISQS